MNQIQFLFCCCLLTLLPISFKAQVVPNSHPNQWRQLQSCQEGCLTCSSLEVCTNCDANRVLIDGKCRCESPRILISNNCECPWYMSQDPTTHNCEYIDLIDVAYQSTVSPLFDAIFQVQMNPILKWATPPTFTWTMNCNYQNTVTQDELTDYLSAQQSDFLRIPSDLLEYNFQCNVKVSYNNQNSLEISKEFSFSTMLSSQPQAQIVGGPFHMFTHTETNVIIAEIQPIVSTPTITWTQLSGDTISLSQSSNSLKVTIPKCTLSPGKLYSFKVSVRDGTNPLLTSQTMTIGVYSPRISLQSVDTGPYHIYNEDLTLIASQFSVQDECNQGLLPVQFLDMLNLKYTWECAIVDLSETARRLNIESADITQNSNTILHPDPQNLFYSSTSTETLTIPSSYFTAYQTNFQFIFYLTATVPSKNPTVSIKNFNLMRPTINVIQTKIYVQIVTSEPFTIVSFACSNPNNCQSLALKNDMTQLTGSNYDPKLTYTWLVQAHSLQFSTQSINNYMTVYASSPGTTSISQIILQATDGTNTASSFFTLPVPSPIQTGSLYIKPSSGESYNTNFFLSTYLSTDDNLPVSYQFFTFCYPGRNLMLQKYEPFDYTTFILPPGRSKCSYGVRMTDNLGHYEEILKSASLTGRSASLSDALSKSMTAMDDSKDSTNLYQRLRLISVILENLQLWENSDPDEASSATSSQFKYSLISETKDIFLALSPRDDIKVIFLNNLVYATNPLFNQDKNWELYMTILDDYYQAESIIDPEFALNFATILDNLIYYMKKPDSKIQDPEKILTYLNTLIKSSILKALPTPATAYDDFVYDGTFFYIDTKKTTYCQAEQALPVFFYVGMELTFVLQPGKTISPEDCNKQADSAFLAFRPNYIVVDDEILTSRSLFFVDLRDSVTGKSLLDTFAFSIYSYGELCPDGPVSCVNDNSGATTITGLFDLRNQIYKTFGKIYGSGSTAYPREQEEQQSFELLKRVAFWTLIALTVLFFVTFLCLVIKNPAYCALKTQKNISKKPLLRKTNLLFWLIHPLTSIFLYNDLKTTKAIRLAIYYQRLVTVLACSSVFSLISEREETVSRAFIILFNILVTLPINSILKRILSWTFDIKPSKKRSLKQAFATFFYLSLLIACIAAIFIIEAQEDRSSSWSRNWGINFAISFLQDLTLAPLISIIIKTLIIKYSSQNKKTSNFTVLLLQNFKPIYTSIFANIPISIETQALTPTEIASPMSTNRKLLKLPTLESASPDLLISPVKRIFRKKRASETAMANVDSVAAETLGTDRFQTLFGEGKTERLQENIPTIQNYEIMQSPNIASLKFSSSSRVASLASRRNFKTNVERNLVNVTSILLNPSSPLSGSVVEIRPEDMLFSSLGSPRESSSPGFFKNDKDIESPKKKTERQPESL